jgi:hypothetical protein
LLSFLTSELWVFDYRRRARELQVDHGSERPGESKESNHEGVEAPPAVSLGEQCHGVHERRRQPVGAAWYLNDVLEII